MRVPLEWLHEYCDPQLDAHQLAERLALTGTEVERVEHHGVQALEYFVVGHVLERRKHPDADRLSVCMVDVGRSTPSQIVCGAPNVQAGQTVGVSRPGAIMPDGTRLEKAKLRGQTSEGMILAEDEVGIGTDHDGIMVLPDGLSPGSPLQDVLPIATDVLVLEITPNRPDCLGIYGIAREVHAATGAALKPPPWATDPGSEGPAEGAAVVNDAGPELCLRFTARIYDGVTIGPSPVWLKARLMAAGQRPISNVVDITNYVMLLTGQPTHAYDLTRVAGRKLTVRRATDGETAQTLDDQTRSLDGEMVVIDDEEGPTGIAGVMGGAGSEVTDDTEQILFEAATWNGPNVHRTSLKLGLRSEASTRFEKQLQPEQTLWAQAVAAQLMTELCGATLRPGTIDVGGPGPQPPAITLRHARMTSLLGMEITNQRASEILNALGFETATVPEGLEVTPPVFRRADISREADVIEEVARLYGLDQLPATLPARRSVFGALTDRQRLTRTITDALIAQGLHEIVGWSFTGAARDRQPPAARRGGRHAGQPAVRGSGPAADHAPHLPAGRGPAQPRPRRPVVAAVRDGGRLPQDIGRRAAAGASARRRAAERPTAPGHLAPPQSRDGRLLRHQGRARSRARRGGHLLGAATRHRALPSPGPLGSDRRGRPQRGLARRASPHDLIRMGAA